MQRSAGHGEWRCRLTHAGLATSEEGEAACVEESVRRATRGARRTAAASLLLAALSTLATGAALLRMEGGPLLATQQDVAALQDVELKLDGGAGGAPVGWYQVYLNTVVRADRGLDSKQLQLLPVGQRVYVTEKSGRRVRIEQPVQGWTSMTTAEGVRILRPDAGNEPLADPNATARIHETVAKFTEMEQKLMEALKGINAWSLKHEKLPPGALAMELRGKHFRGVEGALAAGAAQASKASVRTIQSTKHLTEQFLGKRLRLPRDIESGKFLERGGKAVLSKLQKALSE